MPTANDRPQDRREDVAAAVWRVLDRVGFAGLSMRAVAAELDATTGVVTHYFRSKRELTSFALDLLASRSAARDRRSAPRGRAALRAAVLDMLPLDAPSMTANRIWVSSWDAALGDAQHAADHAARYRASRAKIHDLITDAQGPVDDAADGAAEALHAFVLGLAVQAVLDPGSYPAPRQITLVDEQLARLLGPEPDSSSGR